MKRLTSTTNRPDRPQQASGGKDPIEPAFDSNVGSGSGRRVAEEIPGYTYGELTPSDVSENELENLKASAGFTPEDEDLLHLAGMILVPQTKQIVNHWRGEIIASIPNLARHSRTPEGEAIPEYLAKSNLRFEQWILDTCFRKYDQEWLNYQREIGLRHTSVKKNQSMGLSQPAMSHSATLSLSWRS